MWTGNSDYRPDGPIGEEEKRLYPWARHLVAPVPLRPWWYRWGDGDWGWRHPSCYHKLVRNEADGRIHIYDELQVRNVGSFEQGAVSYTHLDVYKRQAEWCGVLKSISGGTVGEHWRVRLAKARPGEIIPISNEECEELERTPRLWCSRRRVQKFIEDQLETGVCAFANEVFRRQRLELETHSALRETFGVSSS